MDQTNKKNTDAGHKDRSNIDESRVQTELDGLEGQYRGYLSHHEPEYRLVEPPMRSNERTAMPKANSPVKNVPYEVLAMIFGFARAPAVISLVCKDWFHAALGFASLWSTVVVMDADVLNCRELENKMESLKRYFARSKNADLTLSIDVADIHEPDAFSCFSWVFEPALHRVTAFRLAVDSIKNPSDIGDVLCRLGPKLQVLVLEIESFREHGIIPLPPTSTSLESLSLVSKDSALAYSPGSYPSLYHLELHTGKKRSHTPSDWTMIMSLLQQTSRLVVLIIHDGNFLPNDSFEQVNLPHLIVCKMISMSTDSMEWFFGRITLPALKILYTRRRLVGHRPFILENPEFKSECRRTWFCSTGHLKWEETLWTKGKSGRASTWAFMRDGLIPADEDE